METEPLTYLATARDRADRRESDRHVMHQNPEGNLGRVFPVWLPALRAAGYDLGNVPVPTRYAIAAALSRARVELLA